MLATEKGICRVELVNRIDLYQFTGIFSQRMVGRDRSTQQTNISNDIRFSVCTLTFDGKYVVRSSSKVSLFI